MQYLGRLYVTAAELSDYAADIALLPRLDSRRSVLEYFEREGRLRPVCRILFPETVFRRIVRESGTAQVDPNLPVASDGPDLARADGLLRAIRMWPHKPPTIHPLDDGAIEGRDYISREPNVRPWDELKVQVGWHDGRPTFSNDPPTYYRYWHILALAELLATRHSFVSLAAPIRGGIVEAEPPGILATLWTSLQRLAPGIFGTPVWPSWRRFPLVATDAPVSILVIPAGHFAIGTTEIDNHRDGLEALAVFLAYRDRFLSNATIAQGSSWRLEGDALADFRLTEKGCAVFALRWNGLSEDEVVGLIRWHVQRWAIWEHQGLRGVAEAFRTNTIQAIYWFRILTEKTWDEVRQAVGSDAHDLDIMVPDLVRQQRELLQEWLRDWIAPTLGTAGVGAFNLTPAECDELPQWLEDQGLYQVARAIHEIPDVRNTDARIALSNLGKTIEGLGLSFEHTLANLAAGATPSPGATLKPKMEGAWTNEPGIITDLGRHWTLTDTRRGGGFAAQQVAIRTLVDPTAANLPVLKVLLESALVRNQGTHGAFTGTAEATLHEYAATFLAAIALSWKQARIHGFV